MSLAWTSSIWDGIDLVWRLAVLAGVFAIGARLPSLRPVYIGFGAGIAVNSILAMFQWYGPWEIVRELIPQSPMPGGLFLNKNYLAEPAALAFVALVASRLWWLAAAALPALLLPKTRGALLAVGVAAIAWVWTRDRRLAILMMLGVVALAIETVARNGIDATFDQRLAIWRDTAAGMTFWGHGVGSYFTSYAGHSPNFNLLISRPTHAHNDILELFYEFGPGAVLILVLAWQCLRADRLPERLVLIAFITEGMFAFPVHNPATAAMAALCAGHLFAVRVPLRVRLGAWRDGVRDWTVGHKVASGGHPASGARGEAVSA
ncbi:MAG: O-antigen ligase family protein [Nitrobacter sp.]